MTLEEEIYDVLIIGGGVVGLSVLRSATMSGYKCVLVEKEAHLLSAASGSNSGIACTGVDVSPGTLERALIRDSISQMKPFLQQHNIPHRPCGSLVCQWNHDYDNRLHEVLAESHDAGDAHATKLTPRQVHELEPNLSENCAGAVHIPGEIVLDPWLYSIALALHARENGATIYINFEMKPEQSMWDRDKKVWVISQCDKISDSTVDNEGPRVLTARTVVNAAGICADLVQAGVSRDDTMLDPPHWEARPRRGQYRIFSSTDNTSIQHPIQPVPTQRTKGIFCFSTVYNHIVVGPTALDQTSRIDCSIDSDVAQELSEYVKSIIPDIQPEEQHVGGFVGIRPGTNYRDYQVRLYPQRHWIVAAGIRSTGLTASLGIGRHIVHLLSMILPTSVPLEDVRTTPLPPVRQLVEDYKSRGDGTVMIHANLYRVTHPITKLGWEAQTGIANVTC